MSLLLRDKHWVLRIQVLVWTAATAAIAVRYGLIEQLNFYSNDQRYHTDVVRAFIYQLNDVDFLVSGSRLPYTLPAVILNLIGIDPTLALKTVSIVCLLTLTNGFLFLLDGRNLRTQFLTLLLIGCGTIGLFYSVLALRETMMMLVVTRVFRTRSPAERAFLILCAYLLRPHLAVSLLVAQLLVWLWQGIRGAKLQSVFTVTAVAISGSLIGYYLYSYGLNALFGVRDTFGHEWGIEPVTRIASNYFGLQFLTANSETVEFSLQSLLLLRVILVETILTPTMFTLLVFARSRRLSSQHVTLLLAFSIYISLVTNTDFNSFRQNIPFMPIMGLTVLQVLQSTGNKRPRVSVA